MSAVAQVPAHRDRDHLTREALALIGFGIGALGGVSIGGWLGDRRPLATTLTAAACTSVVLLLLTVLSHITVAAITLFVLMGLAGFAVNPVITAMAVRFAGNAPTLASALSTSAFNVGIAAGSAIAGLTLNVGLGVSGPTSSAPPRAR
jgi:predicted MFS family arabinose efflux permease